MTQISNADKQARFRKKEQLKRRADNIFRKWQLEPWNWRSKKPQDIQYSLDKAIELPSGWKDEDCEHAEKRLHQIYLDLISPRDQVASDVHESRNIETAFRTTPELGKLTNDTKAAVENTNALASHIISALNLSNCNDADQAAALMEAVRFVGRSLASNRKVPRSQATVTCLASIGPQYDRPDWFAEKLAMTLGEQIDKDLARDVGRRLSN